MTLLVRKRTPEEVVNALNTFGLLHLTDVLTKVNVT